MKENKNQSKIKQTKNIMGEINTLRSGYLKIQTNGKPLAKLIRKKEERERTQRYKIRHEIRRS